jgi:actin-like ATPase involved in cell morphogenesis
MKLPRLPKALSSFLTVQQSTFWFSSQEVLVLWQNQKQRFPLPESAGFSGGQVSDFQQAAETLSRICEEAGMAARHPLALQTATVFVATGSSPLERKIVKRVFQKAGFQRVTLVSYATALRAFAQRQAIRSGVGLYVGNDVSEAAVFSPADQDGVSLEHSLHAAAEKIQFFLREKHKIEVSVQAAQQLYGQLGRKESLSSHTLRGRSIAQQQVETITLKSADLQTLTTLFRQHLAQELLLLLARPLFRKIQPQHWVVVGDPLLNLFVQQEYKANTVFLQSEFELIQGVKWL